MSKIKPYLIIVVVALATIALVWRTGLKPYVTGE